MTALAAASSTTHTTAVVWRCPACGRICARLAFDPATPSPAVVAEHRCGCNAFSVAAIEDGTLTVRRGRLPRE